MMAFSMKSENTASSCSASFCGFFDMLLDTAALAVSILIPRLRLLF